MPNKNSKKRKQKAKDSKKEDSLIKNIDITNIVPEDIITEDYPIFCFKHLSDASFTSCKDRNFFIDFLKRLNSLSNLGWEEIRKSQHHSFGMESISKTAIKKDLPECVTDDVKKLHVFRANGNNLPFVGLQVGRVFRIFFIEAQFGDIYNHK